MRYLLLGIGLLVLVIAGSAITESQTITTSSPGDDNLLEQLRRDVKTRPTDRKNCSQRLYRLLNLAQLVHAGVGAEALESALPRQVAESVRADLDAGRVEQAGPTIDRAFLALCQAGQDSPMLRRVQRVEFKSPTGQRVVGFLVAPSKPSDRAFVFGHGGFGRKEAWLDLMLAVADGSNAYALSLDFEGAGESSGYSTWSGRIADFSGAIDYLQQRHGLKHFAVGGHSGGGAWPAACAAIEDRRISVAVLWDCIFDFYDAHIAPGAADPGGNPACLLERCSREAQGRMLVPAEVEPSREVAQHLDGIYGDIEQTMSRYRNAAEQLGRVQASRQLAVLHIVAEDVIHPIGQPQTQVFELPRTQTASPVRQRFQNRPLRFRVSGLFGNRYKDWEAALGEPKRTLVIPQTTHSFEMPGRRLGVEATVEWLERHLGHSPKGDG